MSYIRAKRVGQEEADFYQHGFGLPDIDSQGEFDLDMNLDDEILAFVLRTVAEIDDLREGEALVIYKEIF